MPLLPQVGAAPSRHSSPSDGAIVRLSLVCLSEYEWKHKPELDGAGAGRRRFFL